MDGLDAAKRIGSMIHEQTGKRVGISKYEGLAAMTHFNAQKAIKTAEEKDKPFHLYDKKEEDAFFREIGAKFGVKK